MTTPPMTTPFWQSTKFIYAVIAVAAFLALALTGTMTFTSEQSIEFLLGILGINVGAHTLTNVSAIVGQFFGNQQGDGDVVGTVVEAGTDEDEDADDGEEDKDDEDKDSDVE